MSDIRQGMGASGNEQRSAYRKKYLKMRQKSGSSASKTARWLVKNSCISL